MIEALVAALIITAGLAPLLWRIYVRSKWLPARGTVIDVEQIMAESVHGWRPTIEFVANNRRQRFLGGYAQLGGRPSRYKPGDAVDILYNPTNPSRAIIRAWTPYILGTAFAETFAVTFVINQVPLHF